MAKLKHNEPARAAKSIDGRVVINDNELSSYYFQSIAIRKTRHFSRILRETYGIGVVEWRLISGLAREPGAAACTLSRFTLTDKAQVSKALKTLKQKGLVQFDDNERSSTRKKVFLTAEGFDLHDSFAPMVFEREAAIFKGWKDEEIDLFFNLLRRASKNMDDYLDQQN